MELGLKEADKLGFKKALIPPARTRKSERKTTIQVKEEGNLKGIVDLFIGGK